MMLDYQDLFEQLSQLGHGDWCDQLRASAAERLAAGSHGHLAAWSEMLQQLPEIPISEIHWDADAVEVTGAATPAQLADLTRALQTLHPWRKGPFRLFGIDVDAEWRSDRKWRRVAGQLDFTDKMVLDVGSGNGYYGWRMLGAGARMVVGLEPYPLYNIQHAVMSRYLAGKPSAEPHRSAPEQVAPSNHVVPASDQVLPDQLHAFDVCLSMGVLYHARDAFGHLRRLRQSLRPGGTLILETIVVDGGVDSILVPADRYAKMRNVWLLPSPLALERMLVRSGWRNVRLADVSLTTPAEQRTTDWMRFESLSDFLDPNDQSLTVEGHPAPQRAIMLAESPC